MRHYDLPNFLSIHDLQRSPGNIRFENVKFDLADSIGDEFYGVQSGKEVQFEVELSSVVEGVYISGTAHTELFKSCARCGKFGSETVELPVQTFYFYAGKVTDDELNELENSYNLLDNQYIDLVQLLRDIVFEKLEFYPLCSDSCELVQPTNAEEVPEIDERLAVLKQLRLN
jgi:uncharacterized protein